MPDKEISVHVISLGCPKNRVDTEKFLCKLDLPLRLQAEIEKCGLILLNTCAFIEPATRESIRNILELSESRNKNSPEALFVVMGCLPARYSLEELKKEFPEIDFWVQGPGDNKIIGEIRSRLERKDLKPPPNIDFGLRSNAYVKIAEGCDHACAFCAIPHFKGAYVSNKLSAIVDDVSLLLDSGVKEIILVAQDLLSWGHDLHGSPNFIQLLEKLLKLDGLNWLRLLYLYPSLLSNEFLRFMADNCFPLLPYFDLPFQHSEASILEKMGRPFRKDPRAVLENIRKFIPEAAIRTTLITGFPGESEKDFHNLCAFVEESGFSHLGVFAYHAEEGTKAASLPDQLPVEVREERRNIIMDIQAPISESWLTNFLGRNMLVMVDESDFQEWPSLYKGRVWFQAPEIDGICYISGENLQIGNLYEAEITDSAVYDLTALSVQNMPS